ncbi:MAG TPA: trehalose-phosphatase [Dehalococcoidia bacterium]|nr:trehalose-phosphatase [Dehalococcoidia bacterium]
MNAVENTVGLVADVLSERPSALITDIDGTISRIVARPEDAVVSDSARESLRRLARKIDLVAIVTGRERDVARRMVGLDDVTYVGQYAIDDETQHETGGFDAVAAEEAVRPLLADFPCVEIEPKGVSFSLHYRNCDDATVGERLLTVVAPLAQSEGARVVQGKQVLELVPAGLPDKSVAVARLLRDHGIRGVVFIGDDLSDAAVFRAIARRRSEDGLPGLAVAVTDAETDAMVYEAADTTVAGVEGVEAILASLAAQLEEGTA